MNFLRFILVFQFCFIAAHGSDPAKNVVTSAPPPTATVKEKTTSIKDTTSTPVPPKDIVNTKPVSDIPPKPDIPSSVEDKPSLAKDSGIKESKDRPHKDPEDTRGLSTNVLLVSLGGGEDEILISQMAWLLYRHERTVTVLLYGEGQRERSFPSVIKIIHVPVGADDPLRPQGTSLVGITPEESDEAEWASSRLLWARVSACGRLGEVEGAVSATRPSVIVTPLFLHDVCVLALAHRLQVPVVGVLTSRVGAWWSWAQLGVLPPLSSVPVPLTSLGEGSLWSRAANLGHHYSYMSSLRQRWQVRAVGALPKEWGTPTLQDLYARVARLLLSWDPIVDPSVVPIPTAIPIGGFSATFQGETDEDILESVVSNRGGFVVVSGGSLEVNLGRPLLTALEGALNETSFNVIWRATHSSLLPEGGTLEGGRSGKFIFRQTVPLNEVLNHPRHRAFVSTCGESDLMSAVYFGSPVLCIPVTTDQILAATQLHKLGMAEIVLPREATPLRLKTAVTKLTSERRYRLRARQVAEELHDQPLTPSELLLFHIENAARRPDSIRYKIFGSRLPLLQRTNADVWLVLLVFVFFVCAVVSLTAIKVYPILKKTLKAKED